MAVVYCELEETMVDIGTKLVPGFSLTCERCDFFIEIPEADSPEAREKAINLLALNCPHREKHKYVVYDEFSEQR